MNSVVFVMNINILKGKKKDGQMRQYIYSVFRGVDRRGKLPTNSVPF